MAVRAAIGASRLRLVRQTLTENLFLSGTAGCVGIALAYILLTIFRNLAPRRDPEARHCHARLASAVCRAGAFDPRRLAGRSRARPANSFAGVTYGYTHHRRAQGLASPDPGSSADRDLAGTPLWFRPFYCGACGGSSRLIWVYRPARCWWARVDADRQTYRSSEAIRGFFLELEQRLRKLPGAEFVALSDSVPPSERVMMMIFSRIEKQGTPPDTRAGTGGMVSMRTVTPGYFQALELPMSRGRRFTEEDRDSPDGLVIVDERLAQRLYPGEDAVGKRIRPGGSGDWLTITGIAAMPVTQDSSTPAIPSITCCCAIAGTGQGTASPSAFVRNETHEPSRP